MVLSLITFITQFKVIRHTPEFIIAKFFYDYWRGVSSDTELNPIVKKKLERFGLFYNSDQFYVIGNDNFTKKEFQINNSIQNQKPNIIYIALESFSCRLSDVYNSDLPNITPNLKKCLKIRILPFFIIFIMLLHP